MDELILDGKRYLRRKENWTDDKYVIVSETMQKKLNREFYKEKDMTGKPIYEIIQEAQRMKNIGDYSLSAKYFLIALENADMYEERRILPSLTSIYRKNGNPRKAIELFEKYKDEKHIYSEALMTSIAAAYLDLNNIFTAESYAKRAWALANGRGSDELHQLYGRLNVALKVKKQ